MRQLLACLFALAVLAADPTAPWQGPVPARAAVAVAFSLDELVARSTHAVVARAIERRSLWIELGGGRRIVTYTKLAAQQTLLGPAEKDLWVRTLGGVVGKIGQQVSGEAQIEPGSLSLLFLTRAGDGELVVSGMAQGHYPIREASAGAPARLRRSGEIGLLLHPRGRRVVPVTSELDDRDLDSAIAAVRAAKARRDARP
ncbi:MAG: hypothetical protein HY744_13250 [Deltaproteobacteria bacterium]|nr:hypothetical protein [Deltaproteobacteria bacterium]